MEGLQPLITAGGEKGKAPWREHQQGSEPPEGPDAVLEVEAGWGWGGEWKTFQSLECSPKP